MSRYDWEAGTLTIPTAEWPRFKEALRKGHNEQMQQLAEAAATFHEKLVAAGKGKRGFDYVAELRRLMQGSAPQSYRMVPVQATLWQQDSQYEYRLRRVLLTENGKPRRPLKKDFSPATGSTKEFLADTGSIRLSDDKQHCVSWVVSENNHACETARDSPMGRVLFGALGRITWTRGSGGSFVGNDEYNRDSYEAGGGANYTTATYGPKANPQRAGRSIRGFVR